MNPSYCGFFQYNFSYKSFVFLPLLDVIGCSEFYNFYHQIILLYNFYILFKEIFLCKDNQWVILHSLEVVQSLFFLDISANNAKVMLCVTILPV